MGEVLRVLELYSGIGGMHYALKESHASAEVIAAADVNTIANDVYKHNFPNTLLWPKTIEGISLDEFNKLSFDMILMSPPCQPFTRTGLQGDVMDPRTKSFLHIVDILPSLNKLPKCVLLENVKGFETSSARDKLILALENCGYAYQEFLLSPTCMGIPNSRLRYFLIAKCKLEPLCFQVTAQILERFPEDLNTTDLESSSCIHEDMACNPSGIKQQIQNRNDNCCKGHPQKKDSVFKLETEEELTRKWNQDNNESIQELYNYLEKDDELNRSLYLIPPKSLLRYALIMDIVKPTSRRSTCFTKGYGHYIEGTGSILQTAQDTEIETAFKSWDSLSEEEKLRQLSLLHLRYFTPQEIANLHGFPVEFSFPDNVTVKQRYRLLGNSLNVHVVSKLISLMLR